MIKLSIAWKKQNMKAITIRKLLMQLFSLRISLKSLRNFAVIIMMSYMSRIMIQMFIRMVWFARMSLVTK